MSDKPAFEITDLASKSYRIWSNGRIEGFDDMTPCVVINRIQREILQAVQEAIQDLRLPGDKGNRTS